MSLKSYSVIHTADPKMKEVLEIAENVASSRAAVLISGESGTGKELMARYIHTKSTRAAESFSAINCAALPENLLESELFGYERGAFTGADQAKPGKFEIAHRGTFLLDEISEMPLLLQAKLLRVLQEGEVERLGGRRPSKVDVRIVATTNRNMSEMVERGEFREDLYYRLNVIPIEIPALRWRPKDIELLAHLFLKKSCEENGLDQKVFTDLALDKLMQWRWPGNVRELQNVIERSTLLAGHQELLPEDIKIKNFSIDRRESPLKPGMTVSQAEKLLILKTLEFTQQNRTKAAELLGISIRTLRNKINEYKGASA